MKEIDKDGDGTINRGELKRYLMKYLGKKKWGILIIVLVHSLFFYNILLFM